MCNALINFKYISKIVPDAYHGTTLENAYKINESGTFKIDRSQNSYLGDGVYFYESSLGDAIRWGEQKFQGQAPIAVIKSEVNLGRCLDLHNRDHWELVCRIANTLRQKRDNITDAFVINFIASFDDNKVDTVRATHISSQVVNNRHKIFSGSRFMKQQHLMICVRNLDRIISIDICYQAA